MSTCWAEEWYPGPSKKQPTIALSTTEAEYIALVQAAKGSIWLQRLPHEVEQDIEEINTIYEDNQGAIALASNPQFHTRTKHIDIQYYFIRERVESDKVQLEYCPTAEMIADGMKKSWQGIGIGIWWKRWVWKCNSSIMTLKQKSKA